MQKYAFPTNMSTFFRVFRHESPIFSSQAATQGRFQEKTWAKSLRGNYTKFRRSSDHAFPELSFQKGNFFRFFPSRKESFS